MHFHNNFSVRFFWLAFGMLVGCANQTTVHSFQKGSLENKGLQPEKLTQDEIEFSRIRLTRLALEQSENISPAWDPSQRDCAGFVRFLFRQAVAQGPHIWKDKNGSATPYLRGQELISSNFSKVDLSEIATGDVLVYERHGQKVEDTWHLMVVLKAPAAFAKKTLVIYHNGEHGPKGEIRKVWLEDLITSPWTEWRPLSGNANFHGVYRWKAWL